MEFPSDACVNKPDVVRQLAINLFKRSSLISTILVKLSLLPGKRTMAEFGEFGKSTNTFAILFGSTSGTKIKHKSFT